MVICIYSSFYFKKKKKFHQTQSVHKHIKLVITIEKVTDKAKRKLKKNQLYYNNIKSLGILNDQSQKQFVNLIHTFDCQDKIMKLIIFSQFCKLTQMHNSSLLFNN